MTDKEITYVGFMTTELGESVIGTDGDVFYYGPFVSPNLNYLEDYNIDPASTKDEFARLHEVEIYDKSLLEECKKVLKEYEDTCEIINGEYIMTWKSHAPIGEFKFNTTNQVNELKDYIEYREEVELSSCPMGGKCIYENEAQGYIACDVECLRELNGE